ncbi:unnamed protein product, partial [Rotaria sp. Silwood1]
MQTVHVKARKSPYSDTQDVERTKVRDEQVSWNVDWPDYEPKQYTSPIVLNNPPWADDPDPKQIQHYNEIDGNIDRA